MAELVIQASDAARRLVELLQQESKVPWHLEQDSAGASPRLVLEAHPILIISRALWERGYSSGAIEGIEDESLNAIWVAAVMPVW